MSLDSAPAQPDHASGPRKPLSVGVWAAALPVFLAFLGLATFAYPLYVIWPFRAQGAAELAVALAVKQAAPSVTLGCAFAAVACLFAFWNHWRWRGRSLALLSTLLACGSIWLAHFNLYETMFRPMGAPRVMPAAQAKIDPDDMVIAVNVNANARAYPIREMGYHHIANDWVGGVPLVATY